MENETTVLLHKHVTLGSSESCARLSAVTINMGSGGEGREGGALAGDLKRLRRAVATSHYRNGILCIYVLIDHFLMQCSA